MELPPIIQICNDERLWEATSPDDLERRLKVGGLERELSDQATWTIQNFEYVDSDPGGAEEPPSRADFAVTPSATLNPFANTGKCSAEKCTALTTADFIKTVGLYTEAAIIPDPLSGPFARSADGPIDYIDIFRSLKILKKIMPLIDSGVIELAAPVHRFCADCKEKVDHRLKEATESLIAQDFSFKVKLLRTNDKTSILAIELPLFQPDHLHPLITHAVLSKEEGAILERLGGKGKAKTKASTKVIRRVVARTLQNDVSEVMFELETARRTGSLLLAGSRAESIAISALDDTAPPITDVEDWENLRTIDLPWLKALTAEEILILRSEATHALPRLRELLRSRLVTGSARPETLKEIVAELRSQALEVQSELDALKLPRERSFRFGMAGLAMSFVVYGLATQSPPVLATSVAGLLATLGHLRSTERDHHSKASTLISKPAYALLKAKEIISER